MTKVTTPTGPMRCRIPILCKFIFILRYHRTRWNSICLKFINQTELCPILSCWENWFTKSNLVAQLHKYKNTVLLVFFVSQQIVQTFVALTHFFHNAPHIENTYKYINTYVCLLLGLLLDKLVMFHKTKVHWQSKFLLSLSLQIVLYQSGAFFW